MVSILEVNFYNTIEDGLLKFAIIISKFHGKWVLCKHKERNTYEFPGGHRNESEDILTTAKRELYEETGAVEYLMQPICVYSIIGNEGIIDNKDEIFGMLYYADISKFAEMPNHEMEKIELFHTLPDNWTYPGVYPILLQKITNFIDL